VMRVNLAAKPVRRHHKIGKFPTRIPRAKSIEWVEHGRPASRSQADRRDDAHSSELARTVRRRARVGRASADRSVTNHARVTVARARSWKRCGEPGPDRAVWQGRSGPWCGVRGIGTVPQVSRRRHGRRIGRGRIRASSRPSRRRRDGYRGSTGAPPGNVARPARYLRRERGSAMQRSRCDASGWVPARRPLRPLRRLCRVCHRATRRAPFRDLRRAWGSGNAALPVRCLWRMRRPAIQCARSGTPDHQRRCPFGAHSAGAAGCLVSAVSSEPATAAVNGVTTAE
jgi:hypothetical protein